MPHGLLLKIFNHAHHYNSLGIRLYFGTIPGSIVRCSGGSVIRLLVFPVVRLLGCWVVRLFLSPDLLVGPSVTEECETFLSPGWNTPHIKHTLSFGYAMSLFVTRNDTSLFCNRHGCILALLIFQARSLCYPVIRLSVYSYPRISWSIYC